MPSASFRFPNDDVARQWCKLAHRRLEYFIELYSSGRWRHYYTEESFAERMSDVIMAARLWANISLSRQKNNNDTMRPAA